MRLFLSAFFIIPMTFSAESSAAPISVDADGNPWEVFHFREQRGSSSIFRSPQGPVDTLSFGLVNVVPNGKGENDGERVSDFPTTIIARQNGVQREVGFSPDSFDPNAFGAGINYDPSLSGSWEFTITNGPDSLVINSPEVGVVDVPERVTNVQLSQATGITTPTFSWQNNEANADVVRVTIYDLNNRDAFSGNADRVYITTIPEGESSFTVPEGELAEGGLYSARISTRVNRSVEDGTAGTNPSGSSQAGAALVRGDTFFDFQATDLGDENVILPELTFPADGSVVYNFNNPVLANQIQYYDPLVAVGYDYQIGEQDPFFNSFTLPEIGDDLFSLHLWNGTEYAFDSDVMAGIEYFLGDDTERFRILGIETGAALDPFDPTAFVTGLSFAADGQFTGTMTPIIANVPLPAGIILLGGALGGLAFARRRPGSAARVKT